MRERGPSPPSKPAPCPVESMAVTDKSPRTLLAEVRSAIRVRHYSPRTEEAYTHWIRRFLRHHRMRHPRELGEAEITEFATALATVHHCSASTQSQALSALVFLYRHVLHEPFEWLEHLVKAKGHCACRLYSVELRLETCCAA